MATEKKLILLLLTALTKVNLGFERPCNESTSTIEIVQSCPTDEKTNKEAAERKNCEAIQNTCESFVYHCVRNKGKNATMEVCAPWLNIIGHVCGTYDEDFMSIKRLEYEPCINFTNSCPWSYNSSEQFKYPGCYELIKSEKGNYIKVEEKPSGEIIAGLMAAVCVTCFILSISKYIIHVRNKKKKNQGDNPEETHRMIQSISSTTNNDNEATAENQISRDQNEYSIPVSQEPTDTVNDIYIGQRTPNSVPSSFPRQETSIDGDSNEEIPTNTVSSTFTESYHPINARDIGTGDQHVNDAFTVLDGGSGTIPFEDFGVTSQLQDHGMISIGGSVSDIIEEVKKSLDDAKSRIDCIVRETCMKKLKEAEEELYKLKAENRELIKRLSDQEKLLSHKDTKISRQKQDIEEKDQNLEEMQKEISRLKDEVFKLERERDRDRQRENNLNKDC